MSNRYPGGFLTADEPTVSQDEAPGVWTLSQQAGYQGQDLWPLSQHQIERSLRLNSADSAYLSRTPASASNRKTWTWSGWVKRSALGSSQLMVAWPDVNNVTILGFDVDTLLLYTATSGIDYGFNTSAVFRDVNAWYHIVFVYDSTDATTNDRGKIYVNGVQQSGTWTYGTIPSNHDSFFNATVSHNIGRRQTGILYFNGYLAELHFVDGQALTPSSFGEVNATTGVWSPIAYTGTYGTNGFYLDFADNSSTTALGYDAAGSNDWTPNNFSVTAGAGNDSLVDTPTPYGTDTGVGGEVRGNYATLNPLAQSSSVTLANGSLDFSATAANTGGAIATIAVSSGKWYWEVTPTSGTAGCALGIAKLPLSAYALNQTGTYLYLSGGNKRLSPSTDSAYGASFTDNDVIGVALDMDAGTVVFYKNNVSQGTAFSGLSGDFTAWVQDGSPTLAIAANINFGQRPFAYTAPSGFKALCTTNLPNPTVVQGDEYFNTVLYTGNGYPGAGTQTITGVGFQPDFVWIKSRSAASSNHSLYDAARTAGKTLVSNSTAAETTQTDSLTAFTSDGFSLGDNSESGANVNVDAATYVAWNWNAGGSNATNTDGTITSTVRANTTAGFSIVSYTGVSNQPQTVGHGLGVIPNFIIVKNRSSAVNWHVFHSAVMPYTTDGKFMRLNTGDALLTDGSDNVWEASLFSSTVFGIGNANGISGSNYIAYCFAEIEGFSKFGSYTGNGSTDGPFVYCGFRPAFVMFKKTSATSNWTIVDNKRTASYNVVNGVLVPDLSAAEQVLVWADFLSNGFKLRQSYDGINVSGQTYIFMAFAENPFKYSLAR